MRTLKIGDQLMKKRTIVDIQEMKERAGNAGAYDRYVTEKGESYQANPDLLPEQCSGPSTPQLLMGEAIEHLQGRQKEVYIAVMRDDKSMQEAADMLSIGKSSVQTYLDRAIAFITAYCKAAEESGRI